VATTRYPNELIRIAKLVRRLGHTLTVIADSSLCPLVPFAHLAVVAPSKHIPFIGSPTAICCIANYLAIELASRTGQQLKQHQEKLERVYRENDVLFNLKTDPPDYL
jgi:DNA-binding MurR/RpiR family transcriptional regulator